MNCKPRSRAFAYWSRATPADAVDMVDKDRVRRHGLERSVNPGEHRPEVLVVSDAGEHELGALSSRSRRRRRPSARKLGHPRVRLGRRPVVDRDVMPARTFRCPAMGNPITPSPIKATFAIVKFPSLTVCTSCGRYNGSGGVVSHGQAAAGRLLESQPPPHGRRGSAARGLKETS